MTIQNIVAVRNDTLNLALTFTENGSPINISGWTIFFTVKKTADDSDTAALIKADVTSHTDATGGETVISVPKESTNHSGKFPYDIQVKNATGEITTLLIGEIEFKKDITTRTS